MVPTEILQQMIGVVKADKKPEDEEISEPNITEESKGECQLSGTDVQPNDNQQVKGEKAPPRLNPRMMRRIEYEAMNKYLKKYDIPELEIIRDVEFTPSFVGIDPIMERRIIFDGYIKTPMKEIFIEVTRAIQPMSMVFDRIYVQLAKILFYRQAKNIKVELVLILVDLPAQYLHRYSSNNALERFIQAFQPAIGNSLLRIETISFSEDEINLFSNEEIDN